MRRAYRGPQEASQKLEKMAVHRQLSEACCTAAASAAWLSALMALIQRVQLNIMGRTMFLQANVHTDRWVLSLMLIHAVWKKRIVRWKLHRVQGAFTWCWHITEKVV